ncbi:hypothetical protein EYS42_15590 [Aquabacterium lacunae]|uniref:KAP NTPase domain-containing protein n=1 Tax=Aquabacterium lacunae TaxID=2528630 RepID=A0A4Q9GZX7_9BURK|nr:P-loop NTPase fold protein [Aquabacterium lacunae]TBO27858.1 hypothetical protein EYS42_15590 [Aquabacterium lacunae]
MSAPTPSPRLEPDLLSRANFVQHCHDVLEVLDVTSGAVLGLQGHWGSGKTWVLQALKQRLAEGHTAAGQHWVWIDVNPWMFSGSNQVVEQVLDEIGKQFLGGQVAAQFKKFNGALETAQGIGDQVLKFRSLLGKARGHIDWVEAVSPQVAALIKLAAPAAEEDDEKDDSKPEPEVDKQPDRESLHDLKEDLTKKLQGVNFKVVIAYDDLDRMPPVEVCEVIQAIKAVANFPNVVHLMAYDEAVVANALEQHLKIDNGRAYLEKIVNYEVVVPAPLPSVFDEALSTKVQSVLNTVHALPVQESQLQHAVWQRALRVTSGLMKSPRDVERLLVRFQLAVRKLGLQIDLRDLLVVEALALKHPEAIREFGMTYASWTQSVNRSGEQKKPVLVLSSLPVASHSAAVFLIGLLSQGTGETPREVTGRGLEERGNWLSWWQHSDTEQTLTTKELLDATQDEDAFTRSTLWNRVDVAIEHIQQRFADDQASAQKAFKVMCGACVRRQKVDDARALMARIHQPDEFLTQWIKALKDDELKDTWTALVDLCSEDSLEMLFSRAKAAAFDLAALKEVRERWLRDQSKRIFGMYVIDSTAVVALEQITLELSQAEFVAWMREYLPTTSHGKVLERFEKQISEWCVSTSQGASRKAAVRQAVGEHLRQSGSCRQE